MFSASAELYDPIYGAFKNFATESSSIAALIRQHQPQARSVLDVGCGTGEHALHLTQAHSFLVDGIDIDPGLLAVASRKLPNANFHLADMETFSLHRKYDVILCLFSSIGYLKTIRRVTSALSAFRSHIRHDGLIIVEPWFQPGVLSVGEGAVRVAETPHGRVTRSAFTQVAGTASTIHFTYTLESDAGMETLHETHELGLFTTAQMSAAFIDAGLVASFDPVGLTGRGLYLARMP